jgi:hypothetical protein
MISKYLGRYSTKTRKQRTEDVQIQICLRIPEFFYIFTKEVYDILVDLGQIATTQEFVFVKRPALEYEKGAKEKRNASGEVLDEPTVIFG